MGLTIKGQCIPDVTEPMEGGREAGFSRLALGGSDRGGAERGAEEEAAPGARQKADERPRRHKTAGLRAREARSWLWGT